MLKAKAGEPDEALYQRLLSRAQAQAHAVDKVIVGTCYGQRRAALC